jgi:signal transduction histidine kinase
MSLKKKIILSFLISCGILAVLAGSAYITFIEIRKEIRFLELSDILRSKTLQIRRHEKNFLLYGDSKESESVYVYLTDIGDILEKATVVYKNEYLQRLKESIEDYRIKFHHIENTARDFETEFRRLKPTHSQYSVFFPLIESTFLERPLVNADLLKDVFSLDAEAPAIGNLLELSTEIRSLRSQGEEILVISKDLDKSARGRVERSIRILQTSSMVLFPLFFVIGLGALFVISHNVVNRLKILRTAIEKTGKGDFSSLAVPVRRDEVGMLITAFNKMENDLVTREEELSRKNEELHRSRKLASIGTLASGVAHELNNPLNNIYISAQILQKEAGETCSPLVQETLQDIVGQTIRVKRIVGDLLEYARGKEPSLKPVELNDLIRDAYKLLKNTLDMENINFVVNSNNEKILVSADKEQMERVFINLFTNAVDAMTGKGDIIVTLAAEADSVRIWVSDTGKGMDREDLDKVFEPFFTTKDKGTGLGLAIVFNIVKKHKGEIFMESEKNKGTTFYLVFPRIGEINGS